MKHVKAVIFDWAGTVVDYGSLAPMGAFVETFEQFGVSITIDEARGPMGMAKRPHIAALMALPRVAQAWADKYGAQSSGGFFGIPSFAHLPTTKCLEHPEELFDIAIIGSFVSSLVIHNP